LNQTGFEAANDVEMGVVVLAASTFASMIRGSTAVVVMIFIDQTMDVDEFFYMAWKCDRSFLMKSIFLLGLVQKLEEKRVVEVHHWHHKSLLLLSFTPHHDRQTPLPHPSIPVPHGRIPTNQLYIRSNN